jgi:hypothetical protein
MVLRRFVTTLVVAMAVVTASPSVGSTGGTNVDKAAKVLKNADDYRLRLGAALTLGNSGDFKARGPLEEALDDPHPSVRQAAASALAKLGDPLAIPALESKSKTEPNAPTKAAMQKAIVDLKTTSASGASGSGGSSGATPDWGSTKYIVKIQHVSNGTGIRGEALAAVLKKSALSKFGGLSGVFVCDDTASPSIFSTAQSKGLPVLGVDASLASLDQGKFAGDLKIQAKVSFAISKLQVVKASIEGNASSIGSTSAEKNPASLAKLQDMAVDGAVTSAMSKAPSALQAAATK